MTDNSNAALMQRIELALERIPACPPANRGRNRWLSEQFEISQQAVGYWFNLRTPPATDKVHRIAQMARVDFEWLLLGIGTPEGREPAGMFAETTVETAVRCCLVDADMGEPGVSDLTDRIVVVARLIAGGFEPAAAINAAKLARR